MKEKVLLCIVVLHNKGAWTSKDDAGEMRELIESCGGEVVHTIVCKAIPPTASHLITKGKVEEIKALCAQGGHSPEQSRRVDCVVLSADLKGSQQRNLEEDFGVKTLDRTQVILDIFARRASSLEGKMQVELAQLQYMLPRLVGRNQELSRPGGGIGTSGPGETKLEVDRRRIGERIAKLKRDLKEVTQSRQIKRKKRKEHEIPTVALVGYTNAGKSTLLNTLTGAGTRTHDGLFTTLDSLSRQTVLPNNRKVIFSDTVGFMHDLPHGLIEAFKATLEEVQQADLLLHVLDISNANYRNCYTAVNAVLEELKVLDKPAIMVLNKIDKLEHPLTLKNLSFPNVPPQRDPAKAVTFIGNPEGGMTGPPIKTFGGDSLSINSKSNCISISAAKGENIQALLLMIEDMLNTDSVDIDVVLPSGRMDLVHMAHAQGQVYDVQYSAQGIHLRACLPAKLAAAITRAE